MATVGVRELKAHLSDYLERAANGEDITVTRRGKPTVVIGAHGRGDRQPALPEYPPHVQELASQGRIQLPLVRVPLDEPAFTFMLPAGVSLQAWLDEDREDRR